MTPIAEMLAGLAELLASAGVGSWSGASGQAGQMESLPPIIIDGPTPATPDRVIRIKSYYATSRDYTTLTIAGVQVSLRGNRDVGGSIFEMADGVMTALHGVRGMLVGTYPNQRGVSQILFQSGSDIGPDAVGRPVEVMNFYAYLDIPPVLGRTG